MPKLPPRAPAEPTDGPGMGGAGPLEPWHHPALRGQGREASRLRLQEAFGALREVPFGQDVVRGGAAGAPRHLGAEDCLIYVHSGEVRSVRVGLGGAWERGRDPRVLNLSGPGAYAGLGRAAGFIASPNVDARHPDRLVAHYAGVRWTDVGRPEPVRVRCLRMEQLAALLEEDAVLRSWFEALVSVGVTNREINLRLVRENQLFIGLGLPDQNALLSCALPSRKALRIEAGEPIERVHLVVEANVELATGGPEAQVVGMQNGGDLIFASLLAADAGAPAKAPLAARGDVAGTYLEWDVAHLRAVLQRSPVVWSRLQAYAHPEAVTPPVRPVEVLAVVSDDGDDPQSALLAGGLALALAATARERGARVWLLDASDGSVLKRAFGDTIEVQEHSAADELWDGGELVDLGPNAALQCRVNCSPARLMALAEQVRAFPHVEHVVLHLGPARPQQELQLWRNNPEAPSGGATDLRSLLLESLRRVPHQVVWLNGNADGWWTLTDEAPERLIRVDVLTSAMVAGLRHRTATFTQGGTETHRFEDDRPGCRPDAQVRIPDRPADFAAAAHDLTGIVRGGRPAERQAAGPGTPNVVAEAAWRLERMVCRRSVGLALGGGGAWGSAHIGVIEALEAAGIPIDYVAGTSFGSVIGGLYAAGGLSAVRALATDSKVPPPASRRGRLLTRLPLLARLRSQMLGQRRPLAAAVLRGQMGDQRGLGKVLLSFVPGADPEGLTSLAELAIPFFPVSSNLTKQTPYAPYWLDFASAITASGSLAPGFPSMHLRQQVLVDGAPLANVPAQSVRSAGADFVIAVNVVGAEPVLTPPSSPDGAHIRPTGRGWGELRTRGKEGWAVGWLALWKAGVDQALLHGDLLVDLHVSGITIAEMARMEELADQTRAALVEEDFAEMVRERRAAKPGTPPSSLHIELALPAPA